LTKTIDLPAEAPARRTVALVEQWRLGDDEEDVLLGVITSGVLGAAGQVYLVDRQLSQVLVIDPAGELVTILGRKGEGPGELNEPHAIVLLDDGAIGAIQGFPGRIIGLNADGTPAGDVTLGRSAEEGGFSFLRECLRCGDRFVANTGRMVFDMNTGKADQTSSLAVYDPQGTVETVIAKHTQEDDLNRRVFDEAAEFSEIREWTASPSGVIYTTPVHEQYVLTARDLQGNVLHTLRRPFTPRRRSQAEKDAMSDGINIVMNGQRQEVQNKALDVDAAIRDLAVASDGRLFVTNSYQYRMHLPQGTAARYDVISAEGAYLEELTLLVPDFNGEQDVLSFLDGTRFMVIKNFEAASANMDAAFAETEDDGDGEAEPLEIIFLTMP
jgi:hypothetical protein